jgi:hypothetical protein
MLVFFVNKHYSIPLLTCVDMTNEKKMSTYQIANTKMSRTIIYNSKETGITYKEHKQIGKENEIIWYLCFSLYIIFFNAAERKVMVLDLLMHRNFHSLNTR